MISVSIQTKNGSAAGGRSRPSLWTTSEISGFLGYVMLTLKYAAHLVQRRDQPCPNLDEHQPRDRTAFRLMPMPVAEDDFVPPAIMDGPKKGDRCGRFALSFFDTPQSASRLYRVLAQREDAALRYGDHIGEIDLVKGDGLMSLPSKKGHINLHQSDQARFAHRVKQYYRHDNDSGGDNAS
jgi:hypothetical protein